MAAKILISTSVCVTHHLNQAFGCWIFELLAIHTNIREVLNLWIRFFSHIAQKVNDFHRSGVIGSVAGVIALLDALYVKSELLCTG